MKKILLVSALMLVLAAPALAVWDPLVNGNFENGLTGWYLRDGSEPIRSLPQATPLVSTVTHPDQTWVGTNAPWVQVVDSNETMDIEEGYISGGNRLYRDSGNDVGAAVLPTPYGTKAVGWTRTGYKPLDNCAGATKDWAGITWLCQYVKVKPGTHTGVSASAKWAAKPRPGGLKWDFGVTMCIMGDDPGFPTKWHVDWYGDDETTQDPPRHRDSLKPGDSAGNWLTAAGLSNRTVKTESGWIELRIGVHWIQGGFGSTSSPVDNITDLTTCEWAMFDNVTMSLPDSAMIPEPSGIVALLTGLVGLGGLALRRRR